MPAISPHLVDLVQDALLSSFWRLDSLKKYLKRHGISDAALAHLNKTTTKRQFLDWLFPQIEASQKGSGLIRQLATSLSEQQHFPDLVGWEDTDVKLERAKRSIAALSEYLQREQRALTDEKERQRLRHDAEQRRSRNMSHVGQLALLKSTLEDTLLPLLGTTEGGYAFQDWFADLCTLFEVPHKSPYRAGTREVDGSVAVDGTTYLLSLKFEANPLGSPGIDDIRVRLNRVADNTMGIVVSMSGFGKATVDEASGPGTKLLLLGHDHIYAILSGAMTLPEVIVRVREHASRTGRSHLAIADFGA
ncbi:MAG TPA: hypothetical protein VHN77_15460 [Phycisphaerales bacterium]|nr:hypothetical protein [Phycisphaerales bacterium]